MKKRILACCLLIVFSAMAADATRSRSTGRNSRFSRSPNIVKLLTNRIEDLEGKVAKLTKRVQFLEEKLDPNLKTIREFSKKHEIATKFKPPLKIGQIGYMGGDNAFKVEQIIDEKNMIVDFIVESPTRGVPSGRILRTGYSKIVWVSGIDTSNFVDGKSIRYTRPLEITGTKSYETVMGGTKTVFLLEPLTQR